MKKVSNRKTFFSFFAVTMRCCSTGLLLLLFGLNSFGLRLHDHHEHEHEAEESNCITHFSASALRAHQHRDCADTNYCEHVHEHGLFLLCDMAPVLPGASKGFSYQATPVGASHSGGVTFLAPAKDAAFRLGRAVALLCPRDGPGRVCPVTGQQLPLII